MTFRKHVSAQLYGCLQCGEFYASTSYRPEDDGLPPNCPHCRAYQAVGSTAVEIASVRWAPADQTGRPEPVIDPNWNYTSRPPAGQRSQP